MISLLCQTTKVHAGLLGQVCDKNTTANKLSPCKAAYNPEMRNSLGHNRIKPSTIKSGVTSEKYRVTILD